MAAGLSVRVAAMAVLLGLAASGLGFVYVMLVPPARMPPREARRRPPAPAPTENAWTEYSRALADLRRETTPGWLGEAAAAALTPEEHAYLARHPDALTHLRAGAARTRFEYFREAPTVVTPVPDLQALRHLAELATAEARRLKDAGDPDAALALETAAYRYGTDLAQLDAGLLLPLTAAGCRRTAAAALFASLATASAPALARAARAVAAEDDRMPGAGEATASEWRLIHRTVEDGFLGTGEAAGAYRQRVFARFLQQHDAVLDEARPLLEAWDFPGLQRLDERLAAALRSRASSWRSFFLVDNMAARIVEGVVAPLSRPARLLYVDRANGAGFRMLAACRAYQLAHGRLPHDARAALAESGLQWPIDVVTGRPIGYRLETAGATAWLAGFDGRDDGGRTPYLDLVEATIVPGTDLLYPLGSPPPTLRTLASRAGALPKP